jgi:hypothetical protein
MSLRAVCIFLAFAACSTTEPTPVPPVAEQPQPTAPQLYLEPPAVKARVKKIDGRFVAEVVDVRGEPRPQGVDRLQLLLGRDVRVVDPSTAPPSPTPLPVGERPPPSGG